MGYTQPERRAVTGTREDRPCWREVLVGALSGLYPIDQHLEQMLDHLERTS